MRNASSKRNHSCAKKSKKKKWSKPDVKVETVKVEEYWGAVSGTVSTSP